MKLFLKKGGQSVSLPPQRPVPFIHSNPRPVELSNCDTGHSFFHTESRRVPAQSVKRWKKISILSFPLIYCLEHVIY